MSMCHEWHSVGDRLETGMNRHSLQFSQYILAERPRHKPPASTFLCESVDL